MLSSYAKFVRYANACVIIVAMLAGCQNSDELPLGTTSRTGGNGDSSQNMGGTDSTTYAGDSVQVAGVDILNQGDDKAIGYPLVEFCGTGNITSVENNNPIQVASKQNLSAEKIVSETTRFTSSDKEINKNVTKLTGTTTYTRFSKQDLARKEREDGFHNEAFLMFARGSTTTNGLGSSTLRFMQPLPIIVIPTEMRRYDSLSSPMSFSVPVKDSSNNLIFTIESTIEQTSRNGNEVQVRITHNIPTDTDGQLYDKLPMARTSVFVIDTASKKVTAVNTATFYYNSHQKKRKDMTINSHLSKYTLNGQTESTGTCP